MEEWLDSCVSVLQSFVEVVIQQAPDSVEYIREFALEFEVE
jgi:hypothetical protein